MPIRFSCEQCGQRLRVASRKAGQEVRCLKCHEPITVPSDDAPRPPPAVPETPAPNLETATPSSDPPLSEFVVYDEDVEWVYETEEPDEDAVHGRIDPDNVTVPRRVLYIQGILLAVVALIAFVFGVLVGGGGPSESDKQRVAAPCSIEGHIEYVTNGDHRRPDQGSVVLALPIEGRPGSNERASIEGLRPQDPLPNETNAGLRAIKTMGGSYTRTDDQGDYRLRVPRPGSYFVLIVSGNAYRESDEDLNKTELAQIGSYVLPATDLLGDHAYDWHKVAISRDRTTIDHRF